MEIWESAMLLAVVLFGVGLAGTALRRDFLGMMLSLGIMYISGIIVFTAATVPLAQVDGHIIAVFGMILLVSHFVLGIALMKKLGLNYASFKTEMLRMLRG